MAGTLTVTQAACHIPELWSADTRDAVEATVVAAGLVESQKYGLSELRGGPGDTQNIPYISNPTATTKTANSDITLEVIGPSSAEASQSFTISTHQHVAFAVENITNVQSKTNLRSKYTDKAGYALAAAADTNLHTLPQSFSNTVGTLGVEPSFDNWQTASQNLDDNNAPEESRFIIVRPATYYSMRKLDQFVNADYTATLGKMAVGRSRVGTIFGNIPVFKSTLVRAASAGQADNWFCHREGVYYCSQDLRTRADFVITKDSDVVLSTHIYGFAEALQPPITAGGAAATDVFNNVIYGTS
ncbi:hypothetical protein LCGC14_2536610 [marine sediment metagenome]|uniref:Bacteriophage Mu GpT domain-containing protein n=1 Tax=marine sediment metagenome TaxID=412755 RepID=A0A0F9BEW9_9ZZZZ